MPPSIYLVSPAADAPTYFGAEVFAGWGAAPAAFVAGATLPTVAALVPEGWGIRLCDEQVATADADPPEAVVGLTGMVTQWRRLRELALGYRERGRTVVVGGPLATLSPELVRPWCDVLVRGEAEGVAAELFADLARGRPAAEYAGPRPDPLSVPAPRWDLVNNERAMLGAVQTGRGCPFDCDFCDVTSYVGRRPRHRPLPDVLRDLDALHAAGHRDVFVADDNVTADRGRARALLAALRGWNEARGEERVGFSVQASVDAAGDEALLALLAEVGVQVVFLGIETPNAAALREANKRHNLCGDLAERVQAFARHGMVVMGGMIVGFDADGPEVFEAQRALAEEAAIPLCTLGALVAPPGTRLHARLEREGRLVQGVVAGAGSAWETNVVPAGMSREELLAGIRWLANELYRPDAFAGRVTSFLERCPGGSAGRARPDRAVWRDARRVLLRLARLGEAEARMCTEVARAAARRPGSADLVSSLLLRYAQVRHVYDVGGIWGDLRPGPTR